MLRQELNEAMKTAMKARDLPTLGAVRMVLAKIKDRDIEARPTGNPDGIDDAAILSMMQGMIKQRRDSIALYIQGNRQELADKEAEEIAIIERFLPNQLDEAGTKAAIQAVIQEIGAVGIKDMGRTMAALKERHAGGMDFQKASGWVKEALTA